MSLELNKRIVVSNSELYIYKLINFWNEDLQIGISAYLLLNLLQRQSIFYQCTVYAGTLNIS